jgi:regulatory protein YycI of two-component signal transduction system YycFG
MERKRKKRIYLFCCILLTFLIIFSFFKKISSPKTTIINNDISIEENITIENEIIEPEKITVYTTTTVHIRAAASLESQIISTIGINTELIKIGEEGD